MKATNILSLLLGTILIALVTNIVGGVSDIPRNSALFAISLIVVVIGLFFSIQPIKPVIRLTSIDGFIGVLAIGYLFFHNPFGNLWNIGCTALFFIYFLIRLIGQINYTILFYFVLISLTVLVFTGYLQYMGCISSNSPYSKLTGPYRNSGIYAGVLCLLMSVIFTWALHPGFRLRYRKLYFITVLLLIISSPLLIMTTCRSAWLALFIVFFSSFYSFYYQFTNCVVRKINQYLKYWIIAFLIFISFSLYGLYLLKPASVEGRLLIWKVTLQMIKEKPVTGFGTNGFTTNYMHYQASYLKSEATSQEKSLAGNNHSVYNEPLRLTVEYGLLGLLVYIWLIFIIIRMPVKRSISITSARSVLIAGIVWGLFSYPEQAFPVLSILLLALLCVACKRNNIIIQYKPLLSISKYLQLFSFVVSCMFAIETIKLYRNHHLLFNSFELIHENKVDQFIAECTKLEMGMKDEAFFWMFYCTALNKKEDNSVLEEKIINWERLCPSSDAYIMKGDLLQRLNEMDQAEEAYWLAHYMVPSRQKARSRLALLYKKQGRMDDALSLAHEVLKEKVKVYGFETYTIHQELKRIFESQLK